MALPAVEPRELPRFSFVSDYAVARIGRYPSVRTGLAEVLFEMIEVDLAATGEPDQDGRVSTLSVPALAHRTDLVRHAIATLGSEIIGQIASIETVVVDEGDYTVIPEIPAVYEVTVTLAEPVPVDAIPDRIGVVRQVPTGTPAYRRAARGKEWAIELRGSEPEAMARITEIMAGVHARAVRAVLDELGDTEITDAQVMGAIQSLAARSQTIDTWLSEAGEQLEIDRQAGALPYARVTGIAP